MKNNRKFYTFWTVPVDNIQSDLVYRMSLDVDSIEGMKEIAFIQKDEDPCRTEISTGSGHTHIVCSSINEIKEAIKEAYEKE